MRIFSFFTSFFLFYIKVRLLILRKQHELCSWSPVAGGNSPCAYTSQFCYVHMVIPHRFLLLLAFTVIFLSMWTNERTTPGNEKNHIWQHGLLDTDTSTVQHRPPIQPHQETFPPSIGLYPPPPSSPPQADTLPI